MKMINDTFCILPWVHIHLDAITGIPLICCVVNNYILKNGTPMSLYKYTYEEVYNSDYLRQFRKKILMGEKIPVCDFCYQKERIFGSSMRLYANKKWFAVLNIDLHFLEKHAHATNFASYRPFSYLQLNV